MHPGLTDRVLLVLQNKFNVALQGCLSLPMPVVVPKVGLRRQCPKQRLAFAVSVDMGDSTGTARGLTPCWRTLAPSGT